MKVSHGIKSTKSDFRHALLYWQKFRSCGYYYKLYYTSKAVLTFDFHLNFSTRFVSNSVVGSTNVGAGIVPCNTVQFQGQTLLAIHTRRQETRLKCKKRPLETASQKSRVAARRGPCMCLRRLWWPKAKRTFLDQVILGLGLPFPEHLRVMSFPFRVDILPSLGIA